LKDAPEQKGSHHATYVEAGAPNRIGRP
jgi:hypothetical protein